jgi:hypothetical protein
LLVKLNVIARVILLILLNLIGTHSAVK